MSVRRKKAGLVIRSFSLLAPWRKGKADGDALLDGTVVLTKMKLLSHFQEKLLTCDDSASAASTCDKDMSDPCREDCPPEASAYLSALFSNSARLYKFESEDSGVELPSGANSPSTATGSEQSFVVHSRESSVASGETDPRPPPGPLDSVRNTRSTTADSRDNGLSSVSQAAEEAGGPPAPGGPWQTDPETTKPGNHCCQEPMSNDCMRTSGAGESLEEYMEECCRLSEARPARFSPLGSGLGYLQHICQLIEKIGRLQDANLRLQRQICSLQKNGRMSKTKEGFFQQHCSCGAASLAFQDLPSPSGTLSDLTSIPEVSRCRLTAAMTGLDGEDWTVVPLWRRSRSRSSEGGGHFLGGSIEGMSLPPCRLSGNYSLGRLKDIMRKTKLKNQSRLGLVSSPLKMSCPQLYRPDLGPAEAAGRNRHSTISLGHHSKLDLPFLQ